MLARFNGLFNLYCRLTRPGHLPRDFMDAETSKDRVVAKTEREIFASEVTAEARPRAAAAVTA